jgi:hypothetical protein
MSMIQHKDSRSFKVLLYIAGVYHLLWGLSVVFFPAFFFRLSNMAFPNYMELWQVIGFLYVYLRGGLSSGFIESCSSLENSLTWFYQQADHNPVFSKQCLASH